MEKTTTHAVRHVAEEVVDLTPRLQEKVRSQAEELASLYASLQRSTAYSKLCEKRLLEVCPSHQLPVTLAHLHENENSRPPTVLGHNNPIVLNAVQRKTERDVTRKLSALNDKVQALELVKSDLSLKLKECRSQLQSKEKSVNSLTRTNHELSIRIDQLKSKVSSTSSVIPTSLDISSRQREVKYRSELEVKSKEMIVLNDKIDTLESALKLHTNDLLGEDGQKLKTGSEFLSEIARLRGKDKAAVNLILTLKTEIETLTNQMEELKRRNGSLSSQLSDDRKELIRLKTIVDEVSDTEAANTISKLHMTVSESNMEMEALNSYVKDLLDRNLQLQQEYDEVQVSHVNKSKEIESLKIELSAFESCKKVMEEYQSDVRKKDEEIASLKCEVVALSSQLSVKEESWHEANHLQEELLKQLHEASESQHAAEQAELQQKECYLNAMNKIETLNSFVKDLEFKLEVSTSKLLVKNEEYNKLSVELETLNQKIMLNKELCIKMEKAEKMNKKLEEEVLLLRPVKLALTSLEQELECWYQEQEYHQQNDFVLGKEGGDDERTCRKKQIPVFTVDSHQEDVEEDEEGDRMKAYETATMKYIDTFKQVRLNRKDPSQSALYGLTPILYQWSDSIIQSERELGDDLCHILASVMHDKRQSNQERIELKKQLKKYHYEMNSLIVDLEKKQEIILKHESKINELIPFYNTLNETKGMLFQYIKSSDREVTGDTGGCEGVGGKDMNVNTSYDSDDISTEDDVTRRNTHHHHNEDEDFDVLPTHEKANHQIKDNDSNKMMEMDEFVAHIYQLLKKAKEFQFLEKRIKSLHHELINERQRNSELVSKCIKQSETISSYEIENNKIKSENVNYLSNMNKLRNELDTTTEKFELITRDYFELKGQYLELSNLSLISKNQINRFEKQTGDHIYEIMKKAKEIEPILMIKSSLCHHDRQKENVLDANLELSGDDFHFGINHEDENEDFNQCEFNSSGGASSGGGRRRNNNQQMNSLSQMFTLKIIQAFDLLRYYYQHSIELEEALKISKRECDGLDSVNIRLEHLQSKIINENRELRRQALQPNSLPPSSSWSHTANLFHPQRKGDMKENSMMYLNSSTNPRSDGSSTSDRKREQDEEKETKASSRPDSDDACYNSHHRQQLLDIQQR